MTKHKVVVLSPEQMEAKGKFPARLYRTEDELCAYLMAVHRIKLSTATLAIYACPSSGKRKGPQFRLAGRRPLYDQADVDSWVLEYLGEPASSHDRAAVA